MARWPAAALAALLAACTSLEAPRAPPTRALTAQEGRALVAAKLPPKLADRGGWATDIYAAFATLQLAPTEENLCAAIAVTEQESGFKADPPVANLGRIATAEIERQRERAGIPSLVLQAALAVPSSDGRSYAARIEGARTEKELSDAYEDFIDRVPLGRRFLEDRNPVRTGGPMQVGIAYARAHAQARPYPYPVERSIRDEVFTRRGGMYFGIAHLLDYPAAYDSPLYRFADFNAGHYASRNAAFQRAVAQLTGVPLELDGDLLRYQDGRPAQEAGATERAVRTLGRRIRMDDGDIRDDLEKAKGAGFEKTRLYRRVFELADAGGKPAPRAVIPRIALKSAKITRPLTTEWFARRVETRYRACLAR
jgi:hypothetical protein